MARIPISDLGDWAASFVATLGPGLQ